MTLPATYPISIYKGDDFILAFRLKDSDGAYIDLTGWTGRAQLRNTAELLVATFTFTLGNQITTPGLATVSLQDALTATLPLVPLFYDIETTDTATNVQTYLVGPATVVPDITRT